LKLKNVGMRKLLLLSILCPGITVAQQRLHLTLFGGLSNYSGDLQEKRFTLQQSNFAFGAGLKYDVTPNFAFRVAFNHGTIEGDDKKSGNPLLQARNLSFMSKVTEGSVLLEYTLLNLEERRVSPYIYSGLTAFHFNPYAYDTLGNKIYLQPLGTEGQGMGQYPDRKPYKLTQLAIPLGVGIKFRISDNTVLAYEVTVRKTFTDYLDDVSKTYVDQFALAQAHGLKAVAMAYRGGEVKGGSTTYPEDGTLRGGSKYKDWYYFTGFTIYIGFGNGGSLGHGAHGGRNYLGCPNVL
jgi:opacity protein-like surface antigen